MFGVSGAQMQLQNVNRAAVRQKIDKIIPSSGTIKKYLPLSLQTSSISVVIGALFTATIFVLIFGLTGIKIFTRIVEMPQSVIIPLILLLPVVGAYAVNNSITDIYWMLSFGVFGYFMRHYGYPLGPVILGVILSRLLDDNWRRAIISEREDLGRLFLRASSQAPSLLGLFIAVILIFVSQTPVWTGIKTRLFGKAL